jgi:hypothetical protein
MVMWARSDALEIGCRKVPGTSHIRPRKENGEPIPVWGVDCPPCEVAEANNPQWSRSRFRIPLTPDEVEEAAEAVQMAEAALQQQQLAMARQAALAAQQARLGGALEPQADPDDVAITTSDSNVDAAGSVEGAPPAGQRDIAADYTALAKTDLKELARDRGLPVTGTKDELVARHVQFEQGKAQV